jgi:geranylgeranyl diphosphate synthase type II
MIERLEAALRGYLSGREPEILWDAMRYSVFPGGKRLRPMLLIGSCLGTGGTVEKAIPFACAIELIHSYSLIHDDLPAMDNDAVRRGQPSNHIVFGEAMAILAGDGLLNRAYEIMSEVCAADPCWENFEASRRIASAAGSYGMVAGQAADIFYENKTMTQSAILYIHVNKTAALFQACLTAGGALGGADSARLESLSAAGEKLGLAFQIKDDLQDATDMDVSFQKKSSDKKKVTYASLKGIDSAKGDFLTLSAETKEILNRLDWQDDSLLDLIDRMSR